MALRIAKAIVGVALILALPILSSDYIPIEIGAAACACLAAGLGRKTELKTIDWIPALGGILGALLSMYIYAKLLGIVDRLDVGSAGAAIVSGILTGCGVALIMSKGAQIRDCIKYVIYNPRNSRVPNCLGNRRQP